MKYSDYKRKKYIRMKMIYLLLLDLVPSKQFGIVWDLIDEIGPSGTTHCRELAENEYYIKAVNGWTEAEELRRQRFIRSKSM